MRSSLKLDLGLKGLLVLGKRSWRSRDCQSRTSIATGARGLRKGFDDAEGVNPSVEVMPVNDEQEEHV